MLLHDIVYAARSLRAEKARTFLTTLGIIIAVTSVVAVASVGRSAQGLVLSQVTAFGSNLVGVIAGGSQENQPPPVAFGIVTTTLTVADFRAVRDLPHIIAGSPYVISVQSIAKGNTAFITNVNGVGEDLPALEDATVDQGRFFDRRDVETYSRYVVLGNAVATKLGFRDNPLGQQVRIKGHAFVVIGVMAKRGTAFFQDQDNTVFVPVTTAQKLLVGIDYINAMRLKADGPAEIPTVKLQVAETIRRRHHVTDPAKDDFTVRSSDQAVSLLGNVTGAINAFLLIVTAISLLVGGVNVMNVMFVAVRERTREIGLRKALGAKPARILRQFLIESGLIAMLGGVVGLCFGIVIAILVAEIAKRNGLAWHFSLPVQEPVIAIVMSAAVGIGFGVAPARSASRLDAIEALRYE